MRQKSFLIEVFIFLLITAQIALYALMWFRLLGDPSLKTMDFIHFYGAGHLARNGKYTEIYNLTAQAEVQRKVVDTDNYDPLIFNHPPHVVLLLAAIATDNYVQAYIWWTAVRLVAMILCCEWIRRHLRCAGWDRRSSFLAALASISFFPVFIGLLGGQDTIFAMAGLLIWMLALLKEEEVTAGFGLAFATLSPTIAGALAIPMFAARRLASLWFVLGVIVLTIYSFLLVGIGGIRDFIGLLQMSSQAQYYGFDWSKMYNLVGLFMRSIPSLDVRTARIIAWVPAFLSILGMCVLWWNRKSSLMMEHIGIAIVLATLTSPHLYLHGLSFLVLPMLVFVTTLWTHGRKTAALLFIPSSSFVLMLVSLLKPEWDFAAYYILMFALAYGLWSNLRSPQTSERGLQSAI